MYTSTQKTSIHVKPCNIGQCEEHNNRSEAYLARINEKNIYICRDLIPKNESWVSDLMQGRNLQQYHDDIARMVKEKTGRAMQTKERKMVNKKTGRVKTISGSTPIRESVVVCKDDTTMEQLQEFCQRCRELFGITALRINIHRDEGHYENPRDKSSWKPNNHAHIVWDWMNHDTGKSLKLSTDDMSRMQDMVAEALQMERGTSKEETNLEHLERNDFIVAKQKREVEEAKIKADTLQRENEQKEKTSANLDKEIAEKAEKANRENGNKILQGGAAIANALANKAGMGKYAAIEKENAELKASVPKQLEALQLSYEDAVAKEVAKEVAQQISALRDASQQSENKYLALADEHSRLVRQYNDLCEEKRRADAALIQYKRGEQERFNAFTAQSKWKDDILAMLSLLLAKTDQLFREAVEAIVHFARNAYQSFFSSEEASTIKAFMIKFSDNQTDLQSIGKWLVSAAKMIGNLTNRQTARAEKEVESVAQGKYDRMLGRNGGMKL